MIQRSVPKLVDAICSAYNRSMPLPDGTPGLWTPQNIDGDPDNETFCNEAVSYVCTQFNYMTFARPEKRPTGAASANHIYQMLLNDHNGWQEIQPRAAQVWANEGCLVIAAWHNPKGGSGHVCMVMPGEMEFSPGWRENVPKVMNVGPTCFIGKRASWAFSKEKKPLYFLLKEMAT